MYAAKEVAQEMRRIAEGLDQVPDLQVRAYFHFEPALGDKETFVSMAKAMPKPMTKRVYNEGTSYEEFGLCSEFWSIRIPRNAICKIVEPAKPAVYECRSIFSPEEEAELGGEQ